MTAGGRVFGTYGALAAFPRRLAARQLAREDGQLSRGVTRRTTDLVFGRTLLARATEAAIEARFDAGRAGGRRMLSENGFLRLLGLADAGEAATLSRLTLLEQSRLEPRDFDLLALFDAFEHDAEPFSFRDIILARKYAGLVAGGASWYAIARSVHQSGPAASLTAKSLQVEGRGAIYARQGEGRSELNGQLLLELGEGDEADLDNWFTEAEAAEQAGQYAEAAELYRRCLAADPADAVAAFNRANCLRAAGRDVEAVHDYSQAIKRDPAFVEAWFNLACLLAERGHADTARRHFLKAIGLDNTYADPVFNLARLEFDAGRPVEARRWWARYLELDGASEWARIAQRGIQFVDLETLRKSAG